MAKITSFMRVTKQPTAHGKKGNASSHQVRKQQVGGGTIADGEKTMKEEREATGLDEEESKAHVPTFIYQTVKYRSKHETYTVSEQMKTIIEHIERYYDVPEDLERNAKFGCHSGLTYEKRVARAYSMGQLTCKLVDEGEAAPEPICLTCAKVGHTYKSCPQGF
ncbi:unnamed protein product [Hyaloperonospora brassicae]|uniref:CCHC-type domain-containing protein n=1 Tax=Hyaloperonospora brassicae TaxID=162125 RepID=A0AAV0TAH2_HYABA|nr:unnamed protein product [Hyaloperonospora brassicae]